MRRGQSTTEYAVFAAVVVAALIAMSAYIRRAIQANLKVAEEQINAEALPPPQDGGQDVGGPGGGGLGGGGGSGGGGRRDRGVGGRRIH